MKQYWRFTGPILMLVLLTTFATGEEIKTDLSKVWMLYSKIAEKPDVDLTLTDLEISTAYPVKKGLRLGDKLLETYFPIGTYLVQLTATNVPWDWPTRVTYIHMTKEQYEAMMEKYFGGFMISRNAIIKGLMYHRISVKTILPGFNNNIDVLVPKEDFEIFDVDDFGQIEVKKPKVYSSTKDQDPSESEKRAVGGE